MTEFRESPSVWPSRCYLTQILNLWLLKNTEDESIWNEPFRILHNTEAFKVALYLNNRYEVINNHRYLLNGEITSFLHVM